jgi:hypothetical protein
VKVKIVIEADFPENGVPQLTFMEGPHGNPDLFLDVLRAAIRCVHRGPKASGVVAILGAGRRVPASQLLLESCTPAEISSALDRTHDAMMERILKSH